MPIYAYKCESCGHAIDVLQKVSDEPLTICPACGAATLRKQVTAAGFQLKGTGWYVTDFRNGAGATSSCAAEAGTAAAAGAAACAASESVDSVTPCGASCACD
ncbi:MAG: FmdB family zinc ribbon protein [Tepidimonas sp.]|uniref:FmdB family zinc ribbon protein n=1 Tax=Tepidimonas sp. TaxID=2002775 RepID=UPI004054B1CF